MPRSFDEIFDQAAIPDTVTDDELDAMKQDIVYDVTAVLMFHERPAPGRRDPRRLERAEAHLQALSLELLHSDNASEHLAGIADKPVDAEGALLFGCLLHLAKEPEGALWWWQFAAGAESAAAAYCLHLFHLHRGEMRDAEHWWYQSRTLSTKMDYFLPPAVLHLPFDTHSAALREAVERLKVAEVAGAQVHQPDRRLADQIDDLVDSC